MLPESASRRAGAGGMRLAGARRGTDSVTRPAAFPAARKAFYGVDAGPSRPMTVPGRASSMSMIGMSETIG